MALSYAEGVKTVLTSAGWTVDGVNQGVYTGTPPRGLQVGIKDAAHPPAGAVPLAEALLAVSVEFQSGQRGDLSPDVTDITVGHKP